MHIVLVDDSIPFDGNSAASQPLGGAEKAFASLPPALAARGHRVQVFNHASETRRVAGADWETWRGERPGSCDVLIAFRKPELLGFVAQAAHRLLWLASPAASLHGEAARGHLAAHRPVLVFLGEAHRESFQGSHLGLRAVVVPPGIGADYLGTAAAAPLHPPYAVATSHPQLGLDWLIALWRERVHPLCPHAELRLYSAILDRALAGGAVPEPFKAVAEAALAGRENGIAIHRPAADTMMAEAYRGARAHLYPGDPREAYCHTLAESQACGLPAVARPFPATAERVADGVSGRLEGEAEGFAAAVRALLEDDELQRRLAGGARARAAGRSWAAAAEAFEAIWR
jgi:glycosyltransferase involved in cell wall biosynthesis